MNIYLQTPAGLDSEGRAAGGLPLGSNARFVQTPARTCGARSRQAPIGESDLSAIHGIVVALVGGTTLWGVLLGCGFWLLSRLG